MAEGLAKAMPPGTEVVLHDLTGLPDSIVAITNTITGRTVSSPATDLARWLERGPHRLPHRDGGQPLDEVVEHLLPRSLWRRRGLPVRQLRHRLVAQELLAAMTAFVGAPVELMKKSHELAIHPRGG